MTLGIIIYTGINFDYQKKWPIVVNCVNSIRRQNNDDVKITVLCENIDEERKILSKYTGEKVEVFDNPGDGFNKIISGLDCDHFIISRYDTIYSSNSIDFIMNFEKGSGAILNFTSKVKGTGDFAPMFEKVSIEDQFNLCPCVWNVVFDTKTVKNNKLKFGDFTYRDQYIYLMKYIVSSDKINLCDTVLMCLDRTLKIKIKFTYDDYYKLQHNILSFVKELKKSENGVLLSCFVRDFGLPLLSKCYSEKNHERRKFYHSFAKKFMNAAGK